MLLIYPNAYNIFARLGEVSLVYASTLPPTPLRSADPTITPDSLLVNAVRYYCRSIELCEGYLRGYYGLLVVTRKLLAASKLTSTMPTEKVERLQQLATRKLVEIVSKARREENGWEGYDEGEVEAAGRLLDEMGGAPK